MTCPVIYSIHPDIKKEIRFNWDKMNLAPDSEFLKKL